MNVPSMPFLGDASASSLPSFLSSWGPPDVLRRCEASLDDHPGLELGRVVFHTHEIYRGVTAHGECEMRPSGKLRRSGELPAVGDWVALRPGDDGPAVVERVLPRRGVLSRKVPGERTREQILAAHLDTIFLVMGLDRDFNLRRLERLAVLAWDSDAQPVCVLTKSDLHADPASAALDARDVAPGLPVLTVSALQGEGLDPLRAFLEPRRTVALIGSSGAGKSTLINALCGQEIRRTGAVREDDGRGRHTTTDRQLIQLPGGALLVDNPGIREVQLWADEESLDDTFPEIDELARSCRFRDCEHGEEPGCEVVAACREGRLDESRLESWRRLRRELRSLERRQDEAVRRADDRRLGKLYKRIQAEKRGRP